jgi:hypothetical protein
MNETLRFPSIPLRDWISIARPHILGIVFASTLVYGWIFTEHFAIDVALLAVWDWFIVNFMNKATDLDEDAANAIPGATLARENAGAIQAFGFAMIAAGLWAGQALNPALLPWRLVFTAIGLAYNYKVLPVPFGPSSPLARFVRPYPGVLGSFFTRLFFTRLKETYFFKNFGSSMLFTLSVFLYPRYGITGGDAYPWDKLLLCIGFFIPLELTYEIFYDLRDIDGDRALQVPTYPVIHGAEGGKKILLGLLALSALPILAGAASGVLRLRETCVIAGVIQQAWIYRSIASGPKLPTSRQCIAITWLGAAQLMSYVLWVKLGLPLGE